MTRVKAREDLPFGQGVILQGTIGEIQNEFSLETGGKIYQIKWQQDDGNGPGTCRNSLPSEFEVIAD